MSSFLPKQLQCFIIKFWLQKGVKKNKTENKRVDFSVVKVFIQLKKKNAEHVLTS